MSDEYVNPNQNQPYSSEYHAFRLVPTGSLFCMTDPSGANIYLDGILQTQVTPALLSAIVAANHDVMFTKSNYISYTENITVPPNKKATVAAVLIPIATTIDSGIVICTTSIISSCPISPISCPVQVTPLNYVNFIAIINSIQIATATIRFLYSINDTTNYTDVIKSLIVGINTVYAFPSNVRYSPNAIVSLDGVILI